MVGKVRTAAWYMAVVSGDQGGNQSSMTTGNLSSGDGVGLRSVDRMAISIIRIPHDPGLWWIVVIAHHNEVEDINV